MTQLCNRQVEYFHLNIPPKCQRSRCQHISREQHPLPLATQTLSPLERYVLQFTSNNHHHHRFSLTSCIPSQSVQPTSMTISGQAITMPHETSSTPSQQTSHQRSTATRPRKNAFMHTDHADQLCGTHDKPLPAVVLPTKTSSSKTSHT